jgi:hypothetical protein
VRSRTGIDRYNQVAGQLRTLDRLAARAPRRNVRLLIDVLRAREPLQQVLDRRPRRR